jgi:excisionase family DNA binding protein
VGWSGPEFRVLLALYLRRRPERGLTVRVHDLDSLAASMAWEGLTGTLSKALRSLKAKGWIAFESQPGRTRHPYDIELRPDRPEHDPSSYTSSHAGSGNPAPGGDPSTSLLNLSSEHVAKPEGDGGSATVNADPVRAGLDLSRRTTSLSEEDLGPARARGGCAGASRTVRPLLGGVGPAAWRRVLGAGLVSANVPTSAEFAALAARVADLEARLAAATSQSESPYLTIPEAAEYMRASRQRVDDLLSQRRLSRHKDGRRTLLSRAEIEEHLRGDAWRA